MFAEKLFGVPNYNNLGDYRTMPNVTYYVMGDTQNQSNLWNQWATADEWPIAHTQKNFYLQGNNTLNESIPTQNKDYSYSFDPSKPIATRGGANLNQDNRGSFDQNAIENGRNDIIHFDYAIEEPLLITGRVLAKLFVKSDCVDTDFTVKLMDVYPDGKSWLISDGIVRMRYRNGMESEQFMDASNQTVYETMVDLWSTSYYFSEGHTLRIAISSSNYPRFDVNPNTGAKMSPATTSTPYNIANNTIVVSPDYPSALILPIPNSAPRYVYG